jgi:hypothetical protein
MNAPIDEFCYVWKEGGWGWRLVMIVIGIVIACNFAKMILLPLFAIISGYIWMTAGVVVYVLRHKFFRGPVPR